MYVMFAMCVCVCVFVCLFICMQLKVDGKHSLDEYDIGNTIKKVSHWHNVGKLAYCRL